MVSLSTIENINKILLVGEAIIVFGIAISLYLTATLDVNNLINNKKK